MWVRMLSNPFILGGLATFILGIPFLCSKKGSVKLFGGLLMIAGAIVFLYRILHVAVTM